MMRKKIICFVTVCLTAILTAAVFASAAEPNTLPSYLEFTTHSGYLPIVTIDETEPGVNHYTMESNAKNTTPMLYTYDKSIMQPCGGYGDDSLSFTFQAKQHPDLSKPVQDFFFNFGFRLSESSLPAWNQAFGIYLTFYTAYDGKPGKVLLVISDGAPVDPNNIDTDKPDESLYNSIHKAEGEYMDDKPHTVEISIDNATFHIKVVLDKGTDRETVLEHTADKVKDSPDEFDYKGGYAFMGHGAMVDIKNFKGVDSTKAPTPPEEKPTPGDPTPTPTPTPTPSPANDGNRGGLPTGAIVGIVIGGIAVVAGIGVAIYFVVRKKHKK